MKIDICSFSDSPTHLDVDNKKYEDGEMTIQITGRKPFQRGKSSDCGWGIWHVLCIFFGLLKCLTVHLLLCSNLLNVI